MLITILDFLGNLPIRNVCVCLIGGALQPWTKAIDVKTRFPRTAVLTNVLQQSKKFKPRWHVNFFYFRKH